MAEFEGETQRDPQRSPGHGPDRFPRAGADWGARGRIRPAPAAEPAEAGPAGEAAGQSDATDWSALLGMLGGGGDSNPLSALSELDPQLLQAGLRLFPSTPPLTTARWPCSMLSSLLSSRSGMQRLTRPFRSPSWPGSSGWPSSSSRAAERRGRTMYNRYIPNGASYTRVVEEDAPPTQTVPPDAPPPEPDAEAPESAKPASGLGKLLRGLKLDGLDTGDVLLLLIPPVPLSGGGRHGTGHHPGAAPAAGAGITGGRPLPAARYSSTVCSTVPSGNANSVSPKRVRSVDTA